eukprot:scaffold85_cov51-Attheya_sp.AAC.1
MENASCQTIVRERNATSREKEKEVDYRPLVFVHSSCRCVPGALTPSSGHSRCQHGCHHPMIRRGKAQRPKTRVHSSA